MNKDDQSPIQVAYERRNRNRDLDPQLVWRGKDEQDWSDLGGAGAAAVSFRKRSNPKVLIDELLRQEQRS